MVTDETEIRHLVVLILGQSKTNIYGSTSRFLREIRNRTVDLCADFAFRFAFEESDGPVLIT
jgi:hypothetical protein